MIGRSLVIIQRGNNQNELHSTCPWSMALSSRDENFKEKVAKEAEEKKWKPEEIVDDAEVVAIVNATNCIGRPGHHKWASDGVTIINLSGNPDLPDPTEPLRQARRKRYEERQEGKKQLQQYLPELVALRKAIPTGKVQVNVVLPLTVQVNYEISSGTSSISILTNEGKTAHYASELFWNSFDGGKNLAALVSMPEIAVHVECPHRKAYKHRCHELTELLGLEHPDVENATFSAETNHRYDVKPEPYDDE